MPGSDYKDGTWLSADGLTLHYRDYPGDAGRAPVLCVPGLTRNARDFEGVAARLAGRRRVIVVDLRGRGESDRSSDPMTYVPPVYGQDLLALIAQQSLPRVIWFGTSLGGLLAMLIALTAPAVLAGVLLNDIGPELGVAGIARIRSYVGRPARFVRWDDAGRAIAASHADAFPDYKDVDWLAWAHRVCREDADGCIVFDYDPAIAEPFKLPPPEPPFDMWAAFEALRGRPALLVRGALSDVLTEETASAMMTRLPDMDIVTLPHIGHAPTLEELEAVAAIERLLAKVDCE